MIHSARHSERPFSGMIACEVKSGNLFRMLSKVRIVRWRQIQYLAVLHLLAALESHLTCQHSINRRRLTVLASFSRDVLPASEVQ